MNTVDKFIAGVKHWNRTGGDWKVPVILIAGLSAVVGISYLFALFPILPYVGEHMLLGAAIALLGVYVWNKRK